VLKIPRFFICIILLVMQLTAWVRVNSLGGATESSSIVPILVASSSSSSLKKGIESIYGNDDLNELVLLLPPLPLFASMPF